MSVCAGTVRGDDGVGRTLAAPQTRRRYRTTAAAGRWRWLWWM